MDATASSIPQPSALEAPLVIFEPEYAFEQLQEWTVSATKAWTEATDHHMYCLDFFDDAESALTEAREAHKPKRQKRAEAEETRLMNGRYAEEIDDEEYYIESGLKAKFFWSGDDGSGDHGDSEANPDYSVDQQYLGANNGGNGAVGIFQGDPDDFSYA